VVNPAITASEPKTKRTATSPSTTKASWRHHTAEEKAEFISQFEKSELSAAAFCREFKLCEQTFYYWRRQCRRATSAPQPVRTAFAEVSVRTASGAPYAGNAVVKIDLGGGVRVELPTEIDAGWLSCLLNGLRSV
jgi:transposase-like protein